MAEMADTASKRKIKGRAASEPQLKGIIVEDLYKKKWKLGGFIGKGGFGEIYSAQCTSDGNYAKGDSYVVKIEPHVSGPLFVEMHFLMRNARKADIEAFKSAKRLKFLGIPSFIGSGSHVHGEQKYRFVVLEKFGTDIWKLFLDTGKSFAAETVFKISMQIVNVLEYIHSKGYVHADIKGTNILLDAKDKSKVYLIDFGLAEHYTTSKVFKRNPKKCHNGTIEYLSRDAHMGVQTRRGDLEILCYNIVQWLGCTLPWENNLNNPLEVQNLKETHMKDLNQFLKVCFGNNPYPDVLMKLLMYVQTLEFNEEPDYNKVQNMLLSGLKSAGGKINTPLQFETAVKSKKGVALKRKLHVKNVKDTEKSDSESEAKEKTTKENVVKGEKTITTNNVLQTQDVDENNTDDQTDKLIKKPKKTAAKRKFTSKKMLETPEGDSYTPQMLAITEKLKGKKVVKRGKRTEKQVSDKENDDKGLINDNAEMERIRDKINEAEPEAIEEMQVERPLGVEDNEPLAGVSDLEPSIKVAKKAKLKQEKPKSEGRVLRHRK